MSYWPITRWERYPTARPISAPVAALVSLVERPAPWPESPMRPASVSSTPADMLLKEERLTRAH